MRLSLILATIAGSTLALALHQRRRLQAAQLESTLLRAERDEAREQLAEIASARCDLQRRDIELIPVRFVNGVRNTRLEN